MFTSFRSTIRRHLYTMSATAFIIWSAASMRIAAAQQDGKLENPLRFETLQEFIARILQLLVAISIPIIAFFIVYAGFQFVLAQGKEQALNKAKENFKWLIVGAILILGAWALAELLGGTVDQLRP